MPARIVFTGGAELIVVEDGAEVEKALSKDKGGGGFTTFSLPSREGDRPVWVAANEVAFVEHRDAP
jgi:hypothetical protein